MKFYQLLRIIQIIVAQSLSHVRLYNPMDCSMPGFPVLHHLLEFAQTHVHRVSGAIQLSRPLWSPSPAFNLSQHQSLFQLAYSHTINKLLSDETKTNLRQTCLYSQSANRGMECPLDLLQWSTLNTPCLLTDSSGIETLCQILLIFQLDNSIFQFKNHHKLFL